MAAHVLHRNRKIVLGGNRRREKNDVVHGNVCRKLLERKDGHSAAGRKPHQVEFAAWRALTILGDTLSELAGLALFAGHEQMIGPRTEQTGPGEALDVTAVSGGAKARLHTSVAAGPTRPVKKDHDGIRGGGRSAGATGASQQPE